MSTTVGGDTKYQPCMCCTILVHNNQMQLLNVLTNAWFIFKRACRPTCTCSHMSTWVAGSHVYSTTEICTTFTKVPFYAKTFPGIQRVTNMLAPPVQQALLADCAGKICIYINVTLYVSKGQQLHIEVPGEQTTFVGYCDMMSLHIDCPMALWGDYLGIHKSIQLYMYQDLCGLYINAHTQVCTNSLWTRSSLLWIISFELLWIPLEWGVKLVIPLYCSSKSFNRKIVSVLLRTPLSTCTCTCTHIHPCKYSSTKDGRLLVDPLNPLTISRTIPTPKASMDQTGACCLCC